MPQRRYVSGTYAPSAAVLAPARRPELSVWRYLLGDSAAAHVPASQQQGSPQSRARKRNSADTPRHVWIALRRASTAQLAPHGQFWRSHSHNVHHRALSRGGTAAAKELHQKALGLARSRRYNEAAAEFARGIAQHRYNPYFPHSLGVMELQRGDLAAAQAAFERALEIDPDSSVTLQAYAGLHSRQGEVTTARAMYKQAVKVCRRVCCACAGNVCCSLLGQRVLQASASLRAHRQPSLQRDQGCRVDFVP